MLKNSNETLVDIYQKRSRGDVNLLPNLKRVGKSEGSSKPTPVHLRKQIGDQDVKRDWVMVNREPVLTLWAAVVAEALDSSMTKRRPSGWR